MKHVTSINAISKPFDNFWVKAGYRIPTNRFPLVEHFASQMTDANEPITEMVVNSIITNVAAGQEVPVGRAFDVKGIAWDGGRGISSVDVSADGGRSWRSATLGTDHGRFSFRSFSQSFTPNERVKAAYSALGVDWRDVTPAEQIERLAQAPLAHQPGTVWEYGLSTDVLGRVVEKVSGMPLGAFLAERIFAPLKIRDTAFIVPTEKVARLAQPFPADKETGKPITLLDVTVPQKNDAGGAGSAGTAADYARFLQMMLNGGQLDGARVLSRATVAYMTSDHLDTIKPAILLAPGYGFGLGFAVRKGNGVASVPGSTGEYNWGGAAGTGFWVDPKEQLVVVIMTQTVPGIAAQRIDRALWRQAVYQALGD